MRSMATAPYAPLSVASPDLPYWMIERVGQHRQLAAVQRTRIDNELVAGPRAFRALCEQHKFREAGRPAVHQVVQGGVPATTGQVHRQNLESRGVRLVHLVLPPVDW